MRRFLASLLFFVLGCSEDVPLHHLKPHIQVAEQLDLGEVYVGQDIESQLAILNQGDAPLILSAITVEDPKGVFSKAEERPETQLPHTLARATRYPLELHAKPTQPGPHEAKLVIQSNDPDRPRVNVRLKLVARPPLDCDDQNPCTEDVFDLKTGLCEHRFVDNIPCESADKCIQNAQCHLGVCIGTPKVCDDGVDCTEDLCRQSTGECVFVPKPEICDDHNSCTVDACTETGCTHQNRPNGELCDDGDSCTSDDACFAGLCQGVAGDVGLRCDDGDSCTINDHCDVTGRCKGESIIDAKAEGDVVFRYSLRAPGEPTESFFLHRAHVCMGDDGTYYGLDHLEDPSSFQHLVFAFKQCGSTHYQYFYHPSPNPKVAAVRRTLQVDAKGNTRVAVGVRDLPQFGYGLNTTAYLLDPDGKVIETTYSEPGAELGRSMLPDGSYVTARLEATNNAQVPAEATQDLVIRRTDRFKSVLWTYRVPADRWADLLGVAGPRVLFWNRGRFSALDFNTGRMVWSRSTSYASKDMALSTDLNLGLVRADNMIIGVNILTGRERFRYPPTPSLSYRPISDPAISTDGRVLFAMLARKKENDDGLSNFDWIELDADGKLISQTRLPYTYPADHFSARAIDHDDSYPTVANDGVSYYGIGDRFMAIDPGGRLRWTVKSSTAAYTATVPLLRNDKILLINDGDRGIIGIKTNGGVASDKGWSGFRHDGRRSKYTP